VPHAGRLWLAGAGLGGAAILGGWLAFRTDAALPWVDATTTSFSLVAQFMQTRKWIENWLVWIVVDLVYVAMYVSQGLVLTSVLSAIYLGLAVIGWREWRRSLARA
jgi:nicotinamide mononucleotide transporter